MNTVHNNEPAYRAAIDSTIGLETRSPSCEPPVLGHPDGDPRTTPPSDRSSSAGFCARCGVPLPAASKFCFACGATVVHGIRPETTPVVPVSYSSVESSQRPESKAQSTSLHAQLPGDGNMNVLKAVLGIGGFAALIAVIAMYNGAFDSPSHDEVAASPAVYANDRNPSSSPPTDKSVVGQQPKTDYPAESAPTTQPATIALGETVTMELNGNCAPTWKALDQVEVAYSQSPEAFWNALVETHSTSIYSDTQGKVLDFKTGPASGKAMVKMRILSVQPKPGVTDDQLIGEECWTEYEYVKKLYGRDPDLPYVPSKAAVTKDSGGGGGIGLGVGGGVFRVGGGVTAPSLIYKVEPEYSEEARKAKYQGTVLLYVQVDPSGKAVNMRVLHSQGLGLDEKAMEAVKKWKFNPGLKDGKAVTVEAQIEVDFRML